MSNAGRLNGTVLELRQMLFDTESVKLQEPGSVSLAPDERDFSPEAQRF